MDSIATQIVSGTVVSIVSFGFGYFLFRSQRMEETKLEVFRRRLNCYEAISGFLEDLDTFGHKGVAPDDIERRKEFLMRCYKLTGTSRLYVPPEVNELLHSLQDVIDGLPESLADLEEIDEELFSLIEKEIGCHLSNWRIKWEEEKKSYVQRKI